MNAFSADWKPPYTGQEYVYGALNSTWAGPGDCGSLPSKALVIVIAELPLLVWACAEREEAIREKDAANMMP